MSAPVIRVERGNPTPEEVATVVAILLARAERAERVTTDTPPSRWATYWRAAQTTPLPGTWRASITNQVS
jgi:Acyl-CoA carboxylase epsilon subunit